MSEEIEAKIAAVKKRVEERGRENLLNMMRFQDAAEKLTDGELIDEVYAEIASDQPVCSYQSALLEELLTRFQKAVNCDETPGGVTPDGEPVWADEVFEEKEVSS